MSRPSTLDAIAFGHLAIHAFPSLSQPKLFSILTFEAPNLIAFVDRMKVQLFNEFQADVEREALPSDSFIQRFTRSFGSLVQSDSTTLSEEERRERVYNRLSVFGALAVFGIFLGKSGLIPFDSFVEEAATAF